MICNIQPNLVLPNNHHNGWSGIFLPSLLIKALKPSDHLCWRLHLRPFGMNPCRKANSSGALQKTNLAESCMIRGPEVAVGVPKADKPCFCGDRVHGSGGFPQLITENCVVRTPVTLL